MSKTRAMVLGAFFESRWRLFRRGFRKDELSLLLLAVAVGATAGAGVILLHQMVVGLQDIAFGVTVEDLPGLANLYGWWRPLAVPCAGGLVIGLLAMAIRWLRPREIVDVIEANALHGGRMSLVDSVIIALFTVLSVGVGASVGLEAAVTQLGGGVASWASRHLGLGRSAMRTMVGCGAAGAIAAAFNAPLAGAFYALELVIGGYAIAALAPVVVAAIAGTLVSRSFFGSLPVFSIIDRPPMISSHTFWFALLGFAAALLAVLVMRGAALIEGLYRRWQVPGWLRPAIGGLLLGLLALRFPEVLGSGHGAINDTVNRHYGLTFVLGLVAAKAAGATISIGSGFRGGMFSASLFLGSLFGAAWGLTTATLVPDLGPDYGAFVLVGMGAIAAAIVGAPITMILLVFETTLDYQVAIGVAVGVIVASVATRRWFGYSFATWRFHLRGVDLRGAHDINRLAALTVRHVLRRDVVKVPASTTVETLASLFLLGPAKYVFVENPDGNFAGILSNADVNAAMLEERGQVEAGELLEGRPVFVTLSTRLINAQELLEASHLGVLAVVDSTENRHVIGCVTETDLLRRYFEEANTMHQEDLGGVGLVTTELRVPAREGGPKTKQRSAAK